MTAVTENDLKRLEDLIVNGHRAIESQFGSLQQKVENLTKEVNEIKVAIGKLDEKVIALDQKLEKTEANLNKRLDDSNSQIKEVQTRINGQTNWFIGIFSILVTGLLGILSKIAFFPNP